MADPTGSECGVPLLYQTFKNVYELKLYIHSLQYSSGGKYKIDRMEYFSRSTREYDKLMYKEIKYTCCGLSPNGPCQSFIIVKAISGELKIVDCDTVHNHTNPSKERPLPTVSFVGDGVKSREPDPEFSAVFRALFEGHEFSSYDELQQNMSLLCMKTGASYIRRHTTKLPPENEGSRRCVYKRLLYECKHAGTFRSRATQGICRKSKMMNCPSRINFMHEGNGLRLVTFNLTHNHLLAPQPTPVITKKRKGDQLLPVPMPSYCQQPNIPSDLQNSNSFPRLSAVFRDCNTSRPIRTENFYTGDYLPNDTGFQSGHSDLNTLGSVPWSSSARSHHNFSASTKRSYVMDLVDQLFEVASTSESADLDEGANRLRNLIDWWKKDGH
uniref:FAR1 DNA-binding domain n=3 Tax=Schistocephalus solidus TaxID=70667 RepID=A0A0X3NYD5_SCHSO